LSVNKIQQPRSRKNFVLRWNGTWRKQRGRPKSKLKEITEWLKQTDSSRQCQGIGSREYSSWGGSGVVYSRGLKGTLKKRSGNLQTEKLQFTEQDTRRKNSGIPT
jgi:hypothetical protein